MLQPAQVVFSCFTHQTGCCDFGVGKDHAADGGREQDHAEDPYLPLLTNHRSSSVNGTQESDGITFFIIQGLANLSEKKMILFVILLLGYIIILGGNSMIIFVALTDPKLTSPMFFFLYNLSFVDIVYTTTTIPKMLSGFLTDSNTISVLGCFLQMHFFIQLGVTSRAILTVMAYDRYVAICNPLRYTAIMTRPVRLLLAASSCRSLGLRRLLHIASHLHGVAAALLRPECGETWLVRPVICEAAGVLILTSYVLIGVSVSRMGVAQRLKAFGTCAAHLTVVSISYSTASCVYISYRVGNFSPEIRMIVSVLYSALIPFLNPMIYSLKSKELQESIRRTLSRFRPAAVLPTKHINTVS
ncbi:hypothetical protein L3Q82_022597 [Scortum barcoo]|uniref:Uncharacterized protein n=1 Tax=Scortum barcoo TaxID=214431 RepID=A0ACB8X1Z1_9TELE|nr:hypothetical protein L3Q82_022597 [Scortum barcoo]